MIQERISSKTQNCVKKKKTLTLLHFKKPIKLSSVIFKTY